MIFIALYAVVGCIELAIILRMHEATLSEFKSFHEYLGWRRISEMNVWYPLGMLFAIVFWPIFAGFMAQDILAFRRSEAEHRRPFSVQMCDLGPEASMAEIEANEIVIDPLGAAPAIVFGHMNPGWTKFKMQFKKKDRLCSFYAVWKEDQWSGYACVRGKKIAAFFVAQVINR